MVGRISITECAYKTLMERILSGAFPPGTRIDANVIAAADGVSPTPVRNALNRLVGAGLLVSQSNEGFFVPSFTELDLRDLYDGCAAMLALAVARAASGRKRYRPAGNNDASADESVELETETTFRAIMSLCANKRLRGAFAGVNIRLRPARILEGEWIANRHAELRRIKRAHQALELSELERLINAYHFRRMRLAPKIVARLHECERK